MKTIRRANLKDAKKIHAVHMRSIQEVCANHHTPEEIKAWGFRPYNEESRHRAIQHQYVWVIDNDGKIEGYGHLGVTQGEGKMVAHIYGLYLAKEALGQGWGRKLIDEMLIQVKQLGLVQINLESTLTAHQFYQKAGFVDSGPQTTLAIGGLQIRCIPMSMNLMKLRQTT